MKTMLAVLVLLLFSAQAHSADHFQPRGIGGGGAMAGLSFSPYSRLWFVGTDMGTLFRSVDQGTSWRPIRHDQIRFDSNLELSTSVGFASDGKTVFFASGGKNPKKSLDEGKTWKEISLPLEKGEVIRYWLGDSFNKRRIFCATSNGLLRSSDLGAHWQRATGTKDESKGTFILQSSNETTLFHANRQSVFVSRDGGQTFTHWFTPEDTEIRSFSGGADSTSITLALIDTHGKEACAWTTDAKTQSDCGFVWVGSASDSHKLRGLSRTKKEGGNFLRMAENDPKTIYITGGHWTRQYGTKIWVSQDAGKSWDLRFHLYNWDTHPYKPWPKEKLEYSAVGLDVGWDDGFYTSFSVNQRDSSEVGGTGYYFLHISRDFGKKWKAPFTQFADEGERKKGKRWKSNGLEVTSIQKLKFHPKSPKIGYAGAADLGGLATEDGGETWRICRGIFNTNYDYAFDPNDDQVVFAAMGSVHDFPMGNNQIIESAKGGLFRSSDRGKTWIRLTPDSREWNTEFLSVGFDPSRKILYGGMRGKGIARSMDGGRNWTLFNEGLPAGGKIIPQIELDPVDGNVYALLTGDAPLYSNQPMTGIYFLDLRSDDRKWELLRETVHHPKTVGDNVPLWWYPTSFAVDFSTQGRETLWLADMESKGAWLASGIWKSSDRGKNWFRSTQFTHPTAITLDPKNPDLIYASGIHTVDGSWGNGGALFSSNGGASWRKNLEIPFLSNLDGTVLDPNHSGELFYLFFGAGMLHGPLPK